MLREHRSLGSTTAKEPDADPGKVGSLEAHGLRTGRTGVRDELAAIAAGDASVDWTLLRHRLRSASLGNVRTYQSQREWKPGALRALLRLLLNQPVARQDLSDAILLYRLLSARRDSRRVLTEQDHLLFLEASIALNDDTLFDDALRRCRTAGVPEQHLALVVANRVIPEDGAWSNHVGGVFTAGGVEPIVLAPAGGRYFDRLGAPGALSASERGPLVTVIVPTFRPDRRLVTAVRSLCEQTWSELEILVVDDGSGASFAELLTELETMDPRIRILRQSENLGAYAARNLGLQAARGELVTCHDDDDWSHPRKVEVQARQLEATGAPANLTLHVRATEQLTFKRINVNPRLVQPNFSSLMFRRRELLDRCGPWDSVRSSADAEYIERIQATYSNAVLVAGEAPLSLSRLRDSSLTDGELHRGYVSPSRLAYRYSYRYWHRHTEASALHFGDSRPFPAPDELLDAARAYDLVIVADLKATHKMTERAVETARTARTSGYTVGLLHVETVDTARKDELAPPVWEELQRGTGFLTTRSAGTTARLQVSVRESAKDVAQTLRLKVEPVRTSA